MQLRRVHLRALDADFWFRGRRDYGVMSHFYNWSYRVQDPEARVEWIIDAGANIGDETVKFRQYHPHAQIIAVEADAANADVLKKNVTQLPGVHVEAKALWSVAGERLRLVRGANPEASRVTSGNVAGEHVETTSFEKLREVYGFERVGIVKLDIEGAEEELLAEGNTSWLERVDVVIMEVADHESPAGLQRLLRAFPYEVDCTIVNENIVAVRRGSGMCATAYRYISR